jgi:enterochelin esterase-like enzyme
MWFWNKRLVALTLILVAVFLVACDPMAAPQATSVSVIVSPIASITPTPRNTDTPTPTHTPIPTLTPDLAPTATPFPCNEEEGRVIEFNDFPSPTAGGENLRYHVYIPPCYQETQKRFPVAYLLHGLSYREQQWADIGAVDTLNQGILLGVLPPMILVMPYYGNIGQLNQFPPDPSYETVILDELLPAVENDFCVWEDREHRVIGGISRGGFWALSIAFRHPEMFSAVGGHSAFFSTNPNEVPPQFSPLEIADTSALLANSNLRIYLDNGASDSAAQSQQRLSAKLEERSIPHTYVINPIGEHDNTYWSSHITEYLAFYGRDWARDYNELPSCLEPSPPTSVSTP